MWFCRHSRSVTRILKATATDAAVELILGAIARFGAPPPVAVGGLAAVSAGPAAAAASEEPPNEFLCSITGELMKEPVCTATGETYERDAIMQWFRTHKTDPNSNTQVASKKLTPNKPLRLSPHLRVSSCRSAPSNSSVSHLRLTACSKQHKGGSPPLNLA
eukprot:SAG22_NODE_2347_length_2683_cov_2.671053_4_plen_161_part_00